MTLIEAYNELTAEFIYRMGQLRMSEGRNVGHREEERMDAFRRGEAEAARFSASVLKQVTP